MSPGVVVVLAERDALLVAEHAVVGEETELVTGEEPAEDTVLHAETGEACGGWAG